MAYIGNDLRSNEDYKIIDDISSGFNGSETSFALQVGGATPVPFPKFEQQLLISVNGVIQEPDPTGSAGFKLLGTNIVFSSAPTNGHAFFGVIYAGADYVNAGGTFPDGSINFPSITFSADTNTGFTRTASGTVALISDGTKVAQFPTSQGSSGQALITDGGGNLSFGVPTAAFTDITLADSIIHSGDTNTKIRFPAADTVSVETSGSERLRVDSSGNVGIGTTSPNRHLHLHESDSTGATVRFTNTTTGSGENDGLTVGINSSEQAEFWQRENTAMVFATNNTQRMAISASGNVGIGEASPSCGLHIDNPNNAAITQILDTDNSAVKLVFRNNTESANNVQIGANGSSLVFVTGANERMRVDSSGNVAIGSTTANALLDVNGQARFGGNKITLDTNGSISGKITNSTTRSFVLSNSDVNADFFAGRVYQIGPDGTVMIGGSAGTNPNSYSTRNIQLNPVGSTFFNGGNVGIGTTSPSKKLAIDTGTGSDGIFIGSDEVGLSIVTSNTGDSHGRCTILNSSRTDSGSTPFLRLAGQGGIIFAVDLNSERMRIDSSGTVFVGTTNVGGGSGGVRFKNPDVGSSRFGTTITSGSKTLIQFISNGANNIVGSIGVTTTATDFSTSSDYRLKENESLISDGITRLKQLKPYKFNWKSDSSTKVDGFFAHEVSSIVPEAVTGIKDAVAVQEDVDQGIADAIGEPIYQGIDQSKLVPLLTAALQEEIAKREALETRIAALEAV